MGEGSMGGGSLGGRIPFVPATLIYVGTFTLEGGDDVTKRQECAVAGFAPAGCCHEHGEEVGECAVGPVVHEEGEGAYTCVFRHTRPHMFDTSDPIGGQSFHGRYDP